MRAAVCLAAGLLAAASACAEGGPLGAEPRTWIALQAFAPRLHTDLRIDDDFVGSTEGSQIQAEDELNLAERGGAAGFLFGRRIGQSWRIEADYLRSRRAGDTTPTRDLQVGGYRYAAGSVLRTRLRLQFARINAGVSLLQNDTAEIGLAFGGALTRFHLDLEGSGFGQVGWTAGDAMPLVGAYFSAALAPGWRLSGRVDSAEGSGGRSRRASVDAVWQATPLLALGAGLRWMEGRINTDYDLLFDFDHKRVDYRLVGPQLYAAFTF